MPWGAIQQLNSLLDELAHSHPDGCLGGARNAQRKPATTLVSTVEETAAVHHPLHLSASQRAAAFLALPEPTSGTYYAQPRMRSRPVATSFGMICKGRSPVGAVSAMFGPKDCSGCGDDPKKCGQGSPDCMMWKDKCTNIVVGKGVRGEDIRMGQKYFYWGATRPYDNGDWLRFGQTCEVIEKGPRNAKPRSDLTDQEKKDDDKKPWIVTLCDGNMKSTLVKTLGSIKPFPPPYGQDIPPPSAEAREAMLKHKFNNTSDLIADPNGTSMGMQGVCDKMGRILTSEDGHICGENQACITALPADFAKDLPKPGLTEFEEPRAPGKDCWMWFTPECNRKECPPPPYCPAEKAWKPGHKHEKPTYCPPPKKCTPPPPCPAPYWKDMCKLAAGMPWCVSPEAMKAYKGPVELDCDATGTTLRDSPHGPTGCDWLMNVSRNHIQRLPGKIKRLYGPEDGIFSKTEGMPEHAAEKWIVEGDLTGMKPKNDNNEFLAKAKPKAPAQA